MQQPGVESISFNRAALGEARAESLAATMDVVNPIVGEQFRRTEVGSVTLSDSLTKLNQL